VVLVPGSEHHFGERLAATVAELTNKQLLSSRRLSIGHAPAKQGHTPGRRVDYDVDEDVFGREVIIVDDVFRSGGTMRDVAAAALAGGARRVVGLVGARTMRSS
jgi:adenine/guanine phosphoribosyltransferase-like PRPP-binding protein